MHFRRVMPHEITEEVAGYLDKARRWSYPVISPEYFADCLRERDLDLWSLIGKFEGICLICTTFETIDRDKMLNIHYLGGEGIRKIVPEIIDALGSLAKFYNCSKIIYQSRRPALARLIGAQEQSRYYSLEIG